MLDRQFGKYELIRRLGRGGMADVYLARDTGHDRQVAIKLVELRSDRESRDIYDAERRGASLQEQFGRLDSHVPQVHEYGTCDGHFYIDMEYVDGEDLAERIARGPIAPDDAAAIAAEICAFLQNAHAFETTLEGASIRGIIHGDIKPKNIRINRDGQVKVLDFGIAKGLSLTRKLTRNDFGSLSYLSPERLETGDVDVYADYWSVGVLLYEMLAGAPPFDHQDAQKLEQLIRSRQAPPPLPDQCPGALVRIVLKMLAPSVVRRYPNGGAMLSDLQAFRAGEPTEADHSWLADVDEVEATRRTRPPVESTEMTRRTAPVESAGDAGSGPPFDSAQDRPAGTSSSAEAGASRWTVVGVGVADADVTHRTTAASPAALPAQQSTPAKTPRVIAAVWLRNRRLRAAVLVAVFLLVSVLVWNEASVGNAARELRVGLATRQGSEVNRLWDDYQALSRRSLLGLGLAGVRGPLKERLVSLADQVIADYRQDVPAVREAQWRAAAAWLINALRLDPGDRTATASLRYCEGHLQRITGEARLRNRLPAGDNLHQAIMRFQEAARLNSHWPDPYLGLARTYIYGLDDLDKAIDALNEAERRGYRPGNRELVQLADGYRRRAARMQNQADAVRGLAQESECLQKAADDYRRSLDLYGKAIGFGDAGAYLKQVQKQLDAVTARLDRLTKDSAAKSSESGLGAILRSIFGPKGR